jgi:hypothetical protein
MPWLTRLRRRRTKACRRTGGDFLRREPPEVAGSLRATPMIRRVQVWTERAP